MSNRAEQARGARRVDGVLQARGRERVLAADVDEALVAARGERGDRHRFDDRERIALHQDAILERARLGFVRVADQVVRRAGCVRTASHLRPVGNAAPPRPISFDAVTSAITASAPIARAFSSAAKPPAAR